MLRTPNPPSGVANCFLHVKKLNPFLTKIDSEKPPAAKNVVVRTATGAFPSPKALYRIRTIVLSAKNREILGYTVSKAVF